MIRGLMTDKKINVYNRVTAKGSFSLRIEGCGLAHVGSASHKLFPVDQACMFG